MSLLSTNVLCCIIFLLFFYHLHWINLRDANEFKALLLSPTANTVTTVTQAHLELQENHPKFLWAAWARQRPLLPSKLVWSLFFFSLQPDTLPPTLGSGSLFHHPLGPWQGCESIPIPRPINTQTQC